MPVMVQAKVATCIGADDHSAGGGTTEGLLTLHRDDRIVTAVAQAVFYQGALAGLPVKVLRIHGTDDPLCSYSGSQAMYNAHPSSWPKAFLTVTNSGHDRYVWQTTDPTSGYAQAITTTIDWMRYALYSDVAGRN